MPRNRNNNEVGKAFAIGTKITYNGKVYEVTESNSCFDCSLASICPSSDLSASDRMMMFYLEMKELIYLVNVQVIEDLIVNL